MELYVSQDGKVVFNLKGFYFDIAVPGDGGTPITFDGGVGVRPENLKQTHIYIFCVYVNFEK